MKNEQCNAMLVEGNEYAEKVHTYLTGQIPTFKKLLTLRQWANDIGKLSREITFNNN